MKKLLLSIICIIISLNVLQSQDLLDKLTPKPRQAYIREVYSAVFFFNQKMIYLNPDAPEYKSAWYFNNEMKKRSLDTLPITFWNPNDTLIQNSVILGMGDTLINNIFKHVPDQKIAVSKTYPGAEGYVLDVFPSQAIIAGSDGAGLHNGIITFFQLLDVTNMSHSLFACRIVDAPQFPVRWLYYPMNFWVGDNLNKAKKIWDNAVSYKLNGMLVSDYKFNFLENFTQRYFDSLRSAKKYADDNYLKFVAGVFDFGYSNGILYHDVNLASGLPVRNQKFYIEGDTGRLVPQTNVTLSNGGFETHNGNSFSGFGWIDDPGTKSFADNSVKHSGNTSLRFDIQPNLYPSNANYRINYQTPCTPYSYYHVSAWIKTENLGVDYFPPIGIMNKQGKALCFETPTVQMNTDWVKVDVCFNSLESDTILIYWGVWGGSKGKIWWDDLVVEEIPFVNMIRRAGAPINVSHNVLDIAYQEGIDYDTLQDPKTGWVYSYAGGYDFYHTPPIFKIKPAGKIKNGDTLLISYYNTTVIYSDQVMVTMSDPKVYDIIEKEFRMLDSILKPDTYFMGHDEIRVMNWDYGDQQRKMKPAEILADNVNKCVDIIHKYNPTAEIWDWTDMFDEYHNAVKKDYYLVNGDMTGSADIIPNSIGMANWNSGNHENSLKFFSSKGFRQISAPFYDTDENNIRIWKEWTQSTPNFKGMMYTTWASNYYYLKHFGEYSWNHAPYIYHYPPWSNEPNNKFGITLRITGDPWDKDWALSNSKVMYRTGPGNAFESIPFTPTIGSPTTVVLPLTSDNAWLQYYIEATDNKGWTTKVPFGEDKYFELGKLSTKTPILSLNTNKLSFGNVPVNTDKTLWFTILNTGDTTLTIDNVQVDSNQDIFSITGKKVPFDIAPNATEVYIVKFTPNDNIQYNSMLKIHSNAVQPDANVELEGFGENPNSLKENNRNELIELSVNPNPVSGSSIINFELKGDNPEFIELSLIDIEGKLLAKFISNTFFPGIYSLELKGHELPSGKYFIVAKAGGEVFKLPIVIN